MFFCLKCKTRGKEIEPVPQILELDLEPLSIVHIVYSSLRKDQRILFLPSPPHVIFFGPESKREMLAQPCMRPIFLERGRIVLSKSGRLCIIFLYYFPVDIEYHLPK